MRPFTFSSLCLLFNHQRSLISSPLTNWCLPYVSPCKSHVLDATCNPTTYVLGNVNRLGCLTVSCFSLEVVYNWFVVGDCSWFCSLLGFYFTPNAVYFDWRNVYILYWSDFPATFSSNGLFETLCHKTEL